LTYDSITPGLEIAVRVGGEIYRAIVLEKDSKFAWTCNGYTIEEYKSKLEPPRIAIAFQREYAKSWLPQVIHIWDIVNTWENFSPIDACV
jgi:hypothetical protein